MWLWTGTARDSGEAGEGRRPRPDAADLRVGPVVGRLVGDVHHDAGRSDGVHQPRLRLLLLLDRPSGLSAGSDAGSRRVVAVGRARAAARRLAAARCWRGDGTGAIARLVLRRAVARAVVLAVAGAAALLAGPWLTGLDPTTHVYPAIVWVLVIWTRGARRRRHHHAALLRRAPPGRPHDRAARSGHRQRHALLALRRDHGVHHRGGDRGIPAGGMKRHVDLTADAGPRQPVAADDRADHLGRASAAVLHHRRHLVREVRAAGRLLWAASGLPSRGTRPSRWSGSRWSAGRACGDISYGTEADDARSRLARRSTSVSRLCHAAAVGPERGRRPLRRAGRDVLRDLPLMRTGFAALAFAVLAAAWLGPLPDLARHSFAAHMTMHMAVVAVAAPLLALGAGRHPLRSRPRDAAPLRADSRVDDRARRRVGLARAGCCITPRAISRGRSLARAGQLPRRRSSALDRGASAATANSAAFARAPASWRCCSRRCT